MQAQSVIFQNQVFQITTVSDTGFQSKEFNGNQLIKYSNIFKVNRETRRSDSSSRTPTKPVVPSSKITASGEKRARRKKDQIRRRKMLEGYVSRKRPKSKTKNRRGPKPKISPAGSNSNSKSQPNEAQDNMSSSRDSIETIIAENRSQRVRKQVQQFNIGEGDKRSRSVPRPRKIKIEIEPNKDACDSSDKRLEKPNSILNHFHRISPISSTNELQRSKDGINYDDNLLDDAFTNMERDYNRTSPKPVNNSKIMSFIGDEVTLVPLNKSTKTLSNDQLDEPCNLRIADVKSLSDYPKNPVRRNLFQCEFCDGKFCRLNQLAVHKNIHLRVAVRKLDEIAILSPHLRKVGF